MQKDKKLEKTDEFKIKGGFEMNNGGVVLFNKGLTVDSAYVVFSKLRPLFQYIYESQNKIPIEITSLERQTIIDIPYNDSVETPNENIQELIDELEKSTLQNSKVIVRLIGPYNGIVKEFGS